MFAVAYWAQMHSDILHPLGVIDLGQNITDEAPKTTEEEIL